MKGKCERESTHKDVSSLFVNTTNVMEMYMPTEILNLEEDVIRDEDFISIMNDNDGFCPLSEIVNEITQSLSIILNQ